MAKPRPGTLETLAAAAPDQVVLREHATGRTRTRAQWDERAGSLAVALGDRHGIGHGSRVAILLDRPVLELLDLVFALAKLGAIPVHLPPGTDPGAADLVLDADEASDGRLLLGRDVDALVRDAPGGPRPLSGVRTAPRTVLATAGVPSRVVVRDDSHADGSAIATLVGDLLVRARHRTGRGHLLVAPPWLPATMLHANVALVAGGEVVLGPAEPAGWLEALGEHEPGTTVLTPAMVAALLALDADLLEHADTTSLDAAIVAGDHLPVPHRLAAADLLGEESVAPLYATAEAGPVSLVAPDTVPGDPGTAGTPLQGLAVEIQGPGGVAVSRGTAGRIHVRSPLHADGAGPTGDAGLRDGAGRLVVLGRSWPGWRDDDGVPVGPLAVQDALLTAPGVGAAVATADALLAERADDADLDPQALADRVREACGPAAAAVGVTVVDRLARDALGRPRSTG